MKLAVALRGSDHFLEPLLAHWKQKYELVQTIPEADAIFVEWANEQFPLATRSAVRRNVVCRVLGQEYYQWFWKQVDRTKVFKVITENPGYDFEGLDTVFIPEPIDTGFWQPNPDIEPEPNTLLMVGQYDYYKGQMDLLRILGNSHRRFEKVTFVGTFQPKDQVKFITSGKLRHQLKWLALELGINLEMLDYQPREEVRRLYWTHEFAVSNSLHEGCQTFPQEAMACGCATLVGGWMGAEGIYPSDSLFNGYGFWDVYDGMIRRGVETRERQRKWAVDNWSPEKVYPQIDAILEEAAQNES